MITDADFALDGIELIIIISATFVQSILAQSPAVNIVGVLFVVRLILGIGIGGDYPLSAAISSEFASTKRRGRIITATFAQVPAYFFLSSSG